jgi:hypothetical protein
MFSSFTDIKRRLMGSGRIFNFPIHIYFMQFVQGIDNSFLYKTASHRRSFILLNVIKMELVEVISTEARGKSGIKAYA